MPLSSPWQGHQEQHLPMPKELAALRQITWTDLAEELATSTVAIVPLALGNAPLMDFLHLRCLPVVRLLLPPVLPGSSPFPPVTVPNYRLEPSQCLTLQDSIKKCSLRVGAVVCPLTAQSANFKALVLARTRLPCFQLQQKTQSLQWNGERNKTARNRGKSSKTSLLSALGWAF